MYSKILHNSIAIILIVVFQLPSWMQFEHSFHEHKEVKVCDATGYTKHIHQVLDTNCNFLHHPVNFTFTLDKAVFELPIKIDLYNFVAQFVSSFSQQIIPFAHLRAPPFLF